jgi:hypothetical protein
MMSSTLPLEVVPVIFRRLDAVANEHDLRIAELGAFLLHAAGDDEIVPLFERFLLAAPFEGPGLRLHGVDADQVEFLFPATVCRTRLQAQPLHFRRQVLARLHVTATSRAPAFVRVAGNLDDDVTHVVRGDQFGCILCRRVSAAYLDRDRRGQLRQDLHRGWLRLLLAAGYRDERCNDEHKQVFQSHA